MAGDMTQDSSAAQLIHPPQKLKEKAGSGGLDRSILALAQQRLESNTLDFKPIGLHLIRTIDETLHDIRAGKVRGKQAIQRLLYPAMELKAHGAMFHYTLMTEISETLMNLLESLNELDSDVVELIAGYKMAGTVIFSKGLTGNGGVAGNKLRTALNDAYARFYKSRR
jgi:hypothetical protein